MCIAIPSRVVEVGEGSAVIERYGERLEVKTFLLEEKVEIGDYLICQAGAFAIEKVDEETAKEAIRLIEEFTGQ